MPPVPSPLWLEYVKAFFQPSAILLVAYLTYRFGYKNWIKQKHKELELERYKAKLDSCKAVWALLEYLSDKEHPKTIFVKRGTKEDSHYIMRRQQAEKFIAAVPKVFFEKGHGIMMPTPVKDKLFDARATIRRILDATRNEDVEAKEIKVNNIEVINQINAHRTFLNESLREIVMMDE